MKSGNDGLPGRPPLDTRPAISVSSDRAWSSTASRIYSSREKGRFTVDRGL